MDCQGEQLALTFGLLIMTIKSQHGRVCIFIDNSNLFHAIKALKQRERCLNYARLKERLANGFDADVRFYYSMPHRPESSNSEAMRQFDKLTRFYEGIKELGYQMVGLPLRERTIFNGTGRTTIPKEKGLDCEIVYDMAILSRADVYDSFVLVAGDEDYARTIRRIRTDVGISVRVAFFTHAGCSSVLIKEASDFVDLSQEIDFLFRETRLKQYVVA